MNNPQLDEMRRRMGELAVLPPDHPERQALVQEISQIDGSLEEEWIQLLQGDERLRLELARVAPPLGLEERLLRIPEQTAPRRRRIILPPRWFYALAAGVIIGIGIWGAWWASESRAASSMQLIATVTAASHESHPQLGLVSHDWSTIQPVLQEAVHYPIDLPRLDPSLRLVGAKVLTLAGHKMVYTCWQRDETIYSLYQFCGKDFGLEGPIARREIQPKDGRHTVLIWTEDHCDYALVIAEGAPKPDRPAIDSSTS